MPNPSNDFPHFSLVSNTVFHALCCLLQAACYCEQEQKRLIFLVLMCSRGTPVKIVISNFSSTVMSCVSPVWSCASFHVDAQQPEWNSEDRNGRCSHCSLPQQHLSQWHGYWDHRHLPVDKHRWITFLCLIFILFLHSLNIISPVRQQLCFLLHTLRNRRENNSFFSHSASLQIHVTAAGAWENWWPPIHS